MTSSFDPALVFGGCGLVGYHIVKQLKEDGLGPISAASRNPTTNLQTGIDYYPCDICDEEAVSKLLEQLKPRVIFHAASPTADTGSVPFSEFHATNVFGTKNLLSCATACSSVKAFVFISSAAIYKADEHRNIDETAPTWDENSNTYPYMKAKALADALVLQANKGIDSNGEGLLTTALRPHLIYGECDTQFMSSQLATVKAGRTGFQVGDGKNKFTPSYAGNLAKAHVLAAKKLLETSEDGVATEDLRVDGEAFNIHDGEAVLFWDFIRQTWLLAGDNTSNEFRTIPASVAVALSVTIDWAFKLFTLGRGHPPREVSTLTMRYLISDFTYNIDKARQRLGYDPVCDHEGNLRRSIAWEVDHNPEKWAGIKPIE